MLRTRPRSAPRALACALACAATVALVVLGGCGGQDPTMPTSGDAGDALAAVHVTGGPFDDPQVSFKAPLAIGASAKRVEIEGHGDAVPAGGPLLLRYKIFDATSGKALADTYGTAPVSLHLTEGELDPASFAAMQGARYGERLTAVAASVDGTANPAVFVIDVLDLTATGTEKKPDSSLPAVTQDDQGAPVIAPVSMAPPSSVTMATLIEGAGPPVAAGDTIAVQSLAQRLDDGTVTQSTWKDRDPLIVPLADTVEAWLDVLPGVRVGSRVEILSPPELATGAGAMVYVVDVLATGPSAAPGHGQSPSPTSSNSATSSDSAMSSNSATSSDSAMSSDSATSSDSAMSSDSAKG